MIDIKIEGITVTHVEDIENTLHSLDTIVCEPYEPYISPIQGDVLDLCFIVDRTTYVYVFNIGKKEQDRLVEFLKNPVEVTCNWVFKRSLSVTIYEIEKSTRYQVVSWYINKVRGKLNGHFTFDHGGKYVFEVNDLNRLVEQVKGITND
jgi:hypothetical protein